MSPGDGEGSEVAVRPAGRIRRYREEDLEDLYRICLETGDSGEDATSLYSDPLALGHIYAGPYATLEPGLTFVLEDDLGVCGYILGAFDTVEFQRRYEQEWLPPLQRSLPQPVGERESWTPTERLYHQIHHPRDGFDERLSGYPSHLHIDILPRAQGRGNGRRLMDRFLAELRKLGSPGVHLGVGERNASAIAFYLKMGFEELYRVGEGEGKGRVMVRSLAPATVAEPPANQPTGHQ